jgi:hypothetical protein
MNTVLIILCEIVGYLVLSAIASIILKQKGIKIIAKEYGIGIGTAKAKIIEINQKIAKMQKSGASKNEIFEETWGLYDSMKVAKAS